MKKTNNNGLKLLILMAGLALLSLTISLSFIASAQCNDGIDNDRDNKIDLADNGCSNATDTSEDIILGYAPACLVDGDKLYGWQLGVFQVTYNCDHDSCYPCVLMMEMNGNFSTNTLKCAEAEACSFGGATGVDQEAPNLTVTLPAQGGVYSNRNVLFNIRTSESSKIEYFHPTLRKWITLAPSSTGYFKTVNFKDGEQFILIRATDRRGNEIIINRTFFVDTIKPKINKALPSKGFADGNFEVQFTELNPKSLVFYYGNKTKTLDINNDCNLDKKKYICNVNVNLTSFNNQNINTYFVLKDLANNQVQSKAVILAVDTTAPKLLNTNNFFRVSGKYITFNMSVVESNLDSIEYMDMEDSKPRWKTICTKLNNGYCTSKKTLSYGNHDISVQLTDKAGNAVSYALGQFTI